MYYKDNHEIIEESRNRFQTILEYVSGMGLTEEDPAGAPDPAAGGDPMGGDPMGGDPMGGDPMGGAPAPAAPGAPAPGAPAPGAPGAPAPGGDPAAGGEEAPADTGFAPQPADGADPNADPNAGPSAEAPEGEEEDEDTIEIDDLTDKQDETYKHIKGVDKKLEKVMDMVNALVDGIERNNAHIEQTVADMKAEMEKRNPTPAERTQQRVNVSGPFNVDPTNFTPKIDPDQSATPENFKITSSEMDGITDFANIAKSLDQNDFHQTLQDILGY